jgi:Nucleotidyl transferase AbiEii toxin, Type IV TA system
VEPASAFFEQARLLVAVLPQVARHLSFALKGGTAVNLFVRDLPRLSVDIDLAYLPVQEREASLAGIGCLLERSGQSDALLRGTPRMVA